MVIDPTKINGPGELNMSDYQENSSKSYNSEYKNSYKPDMGDRLHEMTRSMLEEAGKNKELIPYRSAVTSADIDPRDQEDFQRTNHNLALHVKMAAEERMSQARVLGESIRFLKTHGIPYAHMPEGYLLVDGDVNLSGRGLTEVHLKGVVINGNLDISYNAIPVLGMFAREVRGSLNYRGNPTSMASLHTYSAAKVLGQVYIDVPDAVASRKKYPDVNPNWEKYMDALKIDGALHIREKSAWQYRIEAWVGKGRRLFSSLLSSRPAVMALPDQRADQALALMLTADTGHQQAFLRDLRQEFPALMEQRVAERQTQLADDQQRAVALVEARKAEQAAQIEHFRELEDKVAQQRRFLEMQVGGSEIDNWIEPTDKTALKPSAAAGLLLDRKK